jgi:hypothetical protein
MRTVWAELNILNILNFFSFSKNQNNRAGALHQNLITNYNTELGNLEDISAKI